MIMNALLIDPSDRLLTLDEAADYMRCSKVFIWYRRKEGKLIAIRAGKKVLLKRSEIDAYLNNSKEGG
jgi:excisionase family DNA binding protein